MSRVASALAANLAARGRSAVALSGGGRVHGDGSGAGAAATFRRASAQTPGPRRRVAPSECPLPLPPQRRWPSELGRRCGGSLSSTPAAGRDGAPPSSAAAPSPAFRPDDGRAAFARSSIGQLLLSWSLLEACRCRPLVAAACRALTWAATPEQRSAGVAAVAGAPLLWIARRTAFAHFCGGERLAECVDTAKALSARGVRCIVDWSAEEKEDEAAWDENAWRKAELLSVAYSALGDSAAFVPIKLTSLVSPSLLERVAAASGGDPFVEEDRLGLSAEDKRRLAEAVNRLASICEAARDGPALLLDAEQSQRQPAVHRIARELQRRFNRGGRALVYDTFQMYLRESPDRLRAAAAAARHGGYTLGVKLVRGAYIEQERALGVLHATKGETDAAYDAAVARLLGEIASATASSNEVSAPPPAALLVATHNRASLEKAVESMERLDLPRDCPQVHFAQIMGMVDNLTYALGSAGYNATKLVVFGNLREVLPWLLRRVQENRDAFGAQSAELPVLRAELRRRLSPLRASL